MLDRLMPPTVAAVELFGDPGDCVLFPEESAVVARAVDKRRREFAAVRMCARAALSRIGIPEVPILPGERGAPQWPVGVVGSMTHCAGYRAAAVAEASRVRTIGVDAEPNRPLPDGVLNGIASPRERRWVSVLTAQHRDVCWDRLLFCVKESAYKAWFPLTGRWLDFDEAEVTVDPVRRTFAARLLVGWPADAQPSMTGFEGWWAVGRGLLLAAIAVPAPEQATRLRAVTNSRDVGGVDVGAGAVRQPGGDVDLQDRVGSGPDRP